MRKSKEILEAEQIVASMLREMTPEDILRKARHFRQMKEYAVAQRVTCTILLCTVWDFYEDFNEQMLKDLYEQYLAYYESFDKGNENIFKQMVAVNDMLGGDLLEGRLFDAVREKGEADD